MEVNQSPFCTNVYLRQLTSIGEVTATYSAQSKSLPPTELTKEKSRIGMFKDVPARTLFRNIFPYL